MAAEGNAPKVAGVRRRNDTLHIRYSDGSRDVIRQAVKGRYQSTKAFRVDADGTVSAEDVNR